MDPFVLVAALFVSAQSEPADAGVPPGPSASAPASVPGFLDRAQAAHAAKAAQPGIANQLVPGTVPVAKQAAVDVDRLLTEAETALTPPPAPAGKPPARPDPKRAITLFQRALAADPTRAAPLWGLSRAHDALGEKRIARHYANLVLRSQAKDRTEEIASAAFWRVEQPE